MEATKACPGILRTDELTNTKVGNLRAACAVLYSILPAGGELAPRMEGARDRGLPNLNRCLFFFGDATFRTCVAAWILALFASTRSQATFTWVPCDQMLQPAGRTALVLLRDRPGASVIRCFLRTARRLEALLVLPWFPWFVPVCRSARVVTDHGLCLRRGRENALASL